MMKPLLQLEWRHDYFANGRLAGFRMVADAPTARLLARYGMSLRMQDGMFSVLSPATDPAFIAYLHDQAPSGRLRFLLRGDPVWFCFITDLPRGWVGMMAFDARGGQADAAGHDLLEPTFGERDGGMADAVAVVTLELEAGVQVQTPSRYRIDLRSREIPWQYHLINRSEMVLDNPAIIDQEGGRMEGPACVEMADGNVALMFSSGRRKLPLQEQPQVIFDLVDGGEIFNGHSAMTRCYIKGLPTPRPDQWQLSSQAPGAESICSMYIYL